MGEQAESPYLEAPQPASLLPLLDPMVSFEDDACSLGWGHRRCAGGGAWDEARGDRARGAIHGKRSAHLMDRPVQPLSLLRDARLP
jgi:hypothetical protein